MSHTSIASVRPWPLTSGSIINYRGVYSCPLQKFLIFSHRFMTFGMYVHFQETMCHIPILKIVHNYHTSIFPVLQVHKFHLLMTHWWGPHEMAPISMVSSSFYIYIYIVYIINFWWLCYFSLFLAHLSPPTWHPSFILVNFVHILIWKQNFWWKSKSWTGTSIKMWQG